MASKGRPAGSTSRYCLIKDKVLSPYEIHVDESTSTYLKVVGETQSTVGYYASLAHLMKSILKEKKVPQGANGKVYTLKEYINAMKEVENDLKELLFPS
jgi:hypothetical protein